jgi:hypothetical protein
MGSKFSKQESLPKFTSSKSLNKNSNYEPPIMILENSNNLKQSTLPVQQIQQTTYKQSILPIQQTNLKQSVQPIQLKQPIITHENENVHDMPDLIDLSSKNKIYDTTYFKEFK